jgi:hypothetical protein
MVPRTLLNESRDDAMKDHSVVESVIDVLQKVFDCDRRLFLVELDRDRAERGVEDHDRMFVVALSVDTASGEACADAHTDHHHREETALVSSNCHGF